MKTFKDVNGRSWSLAINTNTIKRVRDLAKFDLLKVVEDKNAIVTLGSDPIVLVDVLFAICKPEADAASITDEKFAEAIGNGDVLEAATSALLEDLADFFPQHRRTPLKAALAKLDQIRAKAAVLQIQRIEDPAMEASILASLQAVIDAPPQLSGTSSGSLPG